ncbi:MAG: hypothetical protein ACKOX3_10455 [Bacteroidota bacterium]
MKKIIFTLISLSFSLLYGQAANNSDWCTPVKSTSIDHDKLARRNSIPSSAFFYEIDLQKLKNRLTNVPQRGAQKKSDIIIEFPNAYGLFERFKVYESPIMHRDLAVKYPMIKTYAAQGIDDPTATMRFYHRILYR